MNEYWDGPDLSSIETFPKIPRHKTAIKRYGYSRPINAAINDNLLDNTKTLFDYGCGKGDDLRLLKKNGIEASGWDPEFQPSATISPADIVNLGYVVNVIEDLEERASTLQKSCELARELLIVSAQLSMDAKTHNYKPYKDGYLTERGTFQKFFGQKELRNWIEQTLKIGAVPAAPGIFYVFKNEEAKEAFIRSRYRRKASIPKIRQSGASYQAHKDVLQPLLDFILDRGRIPAMHEVAQSQALIEEFGSIRKAFRLLRILLDDSPWEQIAKSRSQDLLIYLALSRFDGRKQFSQLPKELQFDVKAFFSSYKRACGLADNLLFGCGDQEQINKACELSSVGKVTRDALYVHRSALDSLPPMMRTYEGCALTYLGTVEGANIIKFHRKKPQISYLSYPDFEKDPHPKLSSSLSIAQVPGLP
jgi:DNA phosphorothioation-associated putative methyltransferase